MADPVTAVIGVYETVGTIIEIINKAKLRIENALHNPHRAQDLLGSFGRLSEKLQPYHVHVKNSTLNVPDDKLSYFTENIEQLRKILQDTIQLLDATIKRLTPQKGNNIDRLCSCLYRILRANSTATRIDQLEKKATDADDLLGNIIRCLTIVAVVREEGQGTRTHMTTIADRQTATITHHVTTTVAEAANPTQEDFCPSFDVPQNPPHVVLDFSSVSNIEPDTSHPISKEAQLKLAVLPHLDDNSNNHTSTPCHTVGMEGMSGMGKSCALRGLATDNGITNHFKGGLYYMSLGKDATQKDVIHEISNITFMSGGIARSRDVREQITVKAAVSFGQEWFAGKRILLLIDDVWAYNDIDGDVLGTLSRIADAAAGSRVVFTTRDTALSDGKGVANLHFSERDDQASLKILLAAANLEERDIQLIRSKVAEVLDVCGGHPLALTIAGSAIKKLNDLKPPTESDMGDAWDEYVFRLRRDPQHLLRKRLVGESYDMTLKAAFSASLSMLDEKVRPQLSCPLSFSEMYRSLVVLQKQGLLPLHILQILWDTTERGETKEVLQELTSTNLARSDKEVLGLSIHDLQLVFAHSECKENRELQKWHKKLVRSFVPEPITTESNSGATSWNQFIENTCQDDYMRNNISRHLRNGGLGGELYALLKNPNWIVQRLRKHEILGLEEDSGILLENTGQDAEEPESESGDDWAMEMIAKAAKQSYSFVAQNPREAWFQLYARLWPLSERSTIIKRFIEDIGLFAEKPWVKALTSCLTHPGSAMQSTVFCAGYIGWISGVDVDGKITVCGTTSGRSDAYVSTIKNGLIKDTVQTVRNEQALISSSHVDSPPSQSSPIYAVCCKPDGTRFVTGHKDGTVQIWNADTGKAIGDAMCEHSDSVRCVSWSPDGTLVASGSRDETILVWDADSRKSIYSPLHEGEGVLSVAWARDGTRLASGSRDNTCRIWNVKTGEVEGDTLRGHNDLVGCIAWSPNGNRLASGSLDNTVRVWDVKDGMGESKVLNGHTFWVTCVAWSPDGKRVASGSEDKTVRLWDAVSGAVIAILEVASYVRCVEWSRDGDFIVSGSRDKAVRVWDVAKGISEMSNAKSGMSDGVSGMCDATNGIELSASLYSVKFTFDGEGVVCKSEDGMVRVWDAETLKLLQSEETRNFDDARLFGDGAEAAETEEEGSKVRFEYNPGRIWYGSAGGDIDSNVDMCLATLEHPQQDGITLRRVANLWPFKTGKNKSGLLARGWVVPTFFSCLR